MASSIASNVYVGIFRIINELVFEVVSHLDHIVVYEFDIKVI